MRTVISSQQKSILEDFFKKGMKSKGKSCDAMHTEAGLEASLPKAVVVEWVGNRLKKESGRTYEYARKRTAYAKGISAYNLFVHENKDQFTSMNDWAKKWTVLAPDQKTMYREKAKTVEPAINPVKSRLVLLNRLHNTILDLENIGVSLCCFGTDGEGNQINIGNENSRMFIEKRMDIFADYRLHCTNDNSQSSGIVQNKIPELRKKAALHLNKLYADASGKSGPLPYKKVIEGKVLIGGLPEEVLPLRFPSHYGGKKLNAILSCNQIQVLQDSSEVEENIVDEVEENTVVAEPSESRVPTVSEEDVEVLLPLILGPSATSQTKRKIEVKSDAGSSNVKKNKKEKKARKVKTMPGMFSVEKIEQTREKDGSTEYFIKWDGYPNTENTWEPETNIPKTLIEMFKQSSDR